MFMSFFDEEWGFLQEGLKSALARYNAAEGLSDDAAVGAEVHHRAPRHQIAGRSLDEASRRRRARPIQQASNTSSLICLSHIARPSLVSHLHGSARCGV